MDSCKHQLVENNTCMECGVTFGYLENQNIYSLNHTPQKASERSINKELKLLHIPENIKIKANKIYQQITTPTKKGKKRLSLVFFCVYHAYKEEEIIIDPVDITSQLGLKKSVISKSLNNFSNCGYKPKMSIVDPVSLIRLYAERVHTLDKSCIPDIERFAEEIMAKEPEFGEPFPQKIATAIIKFYMELHGHPLPKENYDLLNITHATIGNMVKEIKTIYNQ
jgi:hypothetical protein